VVSGFSTLEGRRQKAPPFLLFWFVKMHWYQPSRPGISVFYGLNQL
jgi:hypothetical protein